MALNQSLSIIIPVYNEENNLLPLYTELRTVLNKIEAAYEIIYIEDGSTDHSFQKLSELRAIDHSIQVIQFRRNFGQTAAFSAGFTAARGDLIITMDADGQNDPNDIPKLLDKMQEGDYDLVTGWRINRNESILRKLLSKSANLIISRSSQVIVHDRGCSLKLFKSDIAKSIRLYGQLHRFMPELASAIGIRIAEVPVNDRKRISGKSKYGSIGRTPRVVLDLITVFYLMTFFTSPMRLFGSLALICSLSGVLIGGSMALTKIYQGLTGGWAAFHAYQIGNRPLLLLSILLIVVGVQLLMMGLLGEMIMRIYYESSDKPIYHVRQILTSDEPIGQALASQKYHDNLYPAHHPKDEHNAE